MSIPVSPCRGKGGGLSNTPSPRRRLSPLVLAPPRQAFAAAVVLAYNAPGVPSLLLTRALADRILSGAVASWCSHPLQSCIPSQDPFPTPAIAPPPASLQVRQGSEYLLAASV